MEPMNRRQGILTALLLSAMVWLAGGCGSSDTVDAPKVDPEGPFAPLAVGTDTTLEVVTWNLKTFPYPTPADQGHDPQTTVDLVVDAVRGLEADIYALQEIESRRSFNEIVSRVDGYSGFRAESAGYSINLALIYRDEGTLSDVSITEIFTDEGRPFPRAPLLMLFTYEGAEMAVIDNHLKCCGNGFIDENDSWDEETRRRDACLMLEDYIDTNLPDRSVIVVGDFNDELDDPVENNVFANFLAAPDRWRFLDMEIALGPSNGWSYPSWPSHLDHILVTDQLFAAAEMPDALIEVVPMHTVMSGGFNVYDRDLSDHLPVAVRLDLD